jgi:hypothetical protein
MGASVAPQYADFESWADIFSGWYTDHEPHNVIIAEQDGEVVGYTHGALDTRKARGPLYYMLRHALTRGICFRPGTAGFYVRCVMDALRDFARGGRPPIDLDKFPSTLHVNLLPTARISGAATEMLAMLFDRLVAQGSRGIVAEMVASNTGVAALARKLGFVNHHAPYPIPGLRGKAGERLTVQVALRDFSSWEPGAWRGTLVTSANSTERSAAR